MADNMAQPGYPPPPPPPPPGAGDAGALTADEKQWGMLSYLIFPMLIGAIIALVTKGTSKFVKFHALQMIFFALSMFVIYIGLWICLVVVMFIPGLNVMFGVLMIPVFMLLGLGSLVVIIMFGIKANNGETPKLPLIGNFAYKMAYGA